MSKEVPYQVIDDAALMEAYPELYTPEVITRNVRNRAMSYDVIKTNYRLGRPTPGVEYKNPLPAKDESNEK